MVRRKFSSLVVLAVARAIRHPPRLIAVLSVSWHTLAPSRSVISRLVKVARRSSQSLKGLLEDLLGKK